MSTLQVLMYALTEHMPCSFMRVSSGFCDCYYHFTISMQKFTSIFDRDTTMLYNVEGRLAAPGHM